MMRPMSWKYLTMTIVWLAIASNVIAQSRMPTPQSRTPAPRARSIPLVPRSDDDVRDFVDNVDRPAAVVDVVLGQGRLITLKQDLAQPNKQSPVLAVGDPSILDFDLVGPRHVRVTGLRIGATDLAITTADQKTYSFEVRVIIDIDLLETKLSAAFPDASLELEQVRDHIIVRGQVRDTRQMERVIETIEAYLASLQAQQMRRTQTRSMGQTGTPDTQSTAAQQPAEGAAPADIASVEQNLRISGNVAAARVINLLQIPGAQQVMLKVQVAELNRTALRQLGVNLLGRDGFVTTPPAAGGAAVPIPGSIGTNIGGADMIGTVAGLLTSGGTTNVTVTVRALRRNNILKILAEPTLVAYHGHEATFLAGGEFPIPVAQNIGAAGGAISVQFKEFGVRLGFIPHILDDERVRLAVTPEVSTIDNTLATTLVAGGTPVPGLSTRRFNTTVEMRQGQTLAMAGLLQVTLDNTTNRIPAIGDVPVMGAFFSNNTGQRIEKELIVMVTPLLVEAVEAHEVGPLPGTEINEPNDLEFYLLGRIESRVGCDFRSTTAWDDPCGCIRRMKLESRYCSGPVGYSCPNGASCR